MPPVFRFAPSPNGYLHLGHAYSALLNFQRAQDAGGRFLVPLPEPRIVDASGTRTIGAGQTGGGWPMPS